MMTPARADATAHRRTGNDAHASDTMSDRPNRTTRELADEIARHMGTTGADVYEMALRSLACAVYGLDQVLPDYGRISARDLLSLARQIPPADQDDGHAIAVRLPSLDTADECVTVRRYPMQ